MPQFDVRFFPSEVFWTLFSFALLFALLRWLVLPRLNAILEQRAGAIEEDLDRARQQREAAEALRADYQERLDAVGEDAKRMFKEGEEKLRREHRQMMDEWNADMRRREMAFREETEAARLRAIREVRADAAELVAGAVEKLLHEHMDEHEAEQALNEAIAELALKDERGLRH